MTIKQQKILAITLLVSGFILFIVNAFIYPFNPGKPIYKDIAQTFDSILIPESWEVIATSENRGSMFERACGIETGSTCFHKSATYRTPSDQTFDVLELVQKQTGCVITENIKQSEEGAQRFECRLDNGATINVSQRGAENEVYIGVSGNPYDY